MPLYILNPTAIKDDRHLNESSCKEMYDDRVKKQI